MSCISDNTLMLDSEADNLFNSAIVAFQLVRASCSSHPPGSKISVLHATLKFRISNVFARILSIALHCSECLSQTVLPFYATYNGFALACGVVVLAGWCIQQQFFGPLPTTQVMHGHFKFPSREGFVNPKYMAAYGDV